MGLDNPLGGTVQIEAGNFPDDPYIDDLNRQLRQNLLNQLPPQIPQRFGLPIPNIGLYQLSLPQYGGNTDPIARAIAQFSYKNKRPGEGAEGEGKGKDSSGLFPAEKYVDNPDDRGKAGGPQDPFWKTFGFGQNASGAGGTTQFGDPGMGIGLDTQFGFDPSAPWGTQTASDIYADIFGLYGAGGPYAATTPTGPPPGGVNQGQSRGARMANFVGAGLGALGDILSWYQDKRNADKYRRFVEQQTAETKRLAGQYSSPENFLYLLKTFLPRAREISSGGGSALESTVASGLARSGMTGTGIGQAIQGGAANAGQMEALRLAASLAGQAQQQQLGTLGLSAFDPYNPMARESFNQPGLGEALQSWAARSGLMGRALAGGRGGSQADQDRFWARILRQMSGQQDDDDTLAV